MRGYSKLVECLLRDAHTLSSSSAQKIHKKAGIIVSTHNPSAWDVKQGHREENLILDSRPRMKSNVYALIQLCFHLTNNHLGHGPVSSEYSCPKALSSVAEGLFSAALLILLKTPEAQLLSVSCVSVRTLFQFPKTMGKSQAQ